VKLKGIDGRTLLECRGNGGQTVVPPSVHETGELIEFTEMADPGPADFNDLLLKCRLMAAAIEIAPHWRNGSRHDLSLALTGALLRAGMSLADSAEVLRGICLLTEDEEVEDRIRSIQTTSDKGIKLVGGIEMHSNIPSSNAHSVANSFLDMIH
jgi:hypothetical protein